MTGQIKFVNLALKSTSIKVLKVINLAQKRFTNKGLFGRTVDTIAKCYGDLGDSRSGYLCCRSSLHNIIFNAFRLVFVLWSLLAADSFLFLTS